MLWSISIHSPQSYVLPQIIFVAIGLVLFIGAILVDFQFILRWSWVWWALTVLALVVVALFSVVTRGAASWIDFGPVSLQPSEFAKVTVVLIMAAIAQQYASRWNNQLQLLLAYGLVLALPLGLVLLQPDIGTAAVILIGWLTVVWLSPFNRAVVGSLMLSVLAALLAGWTFLAEYQRLRILNFLNPSADPLGSGYNVLQSIIAVGSGSLFGYGWGRGPQSHLYFLPEHHTDFIFASLSEEFGFIGSMFVVLMYAVILWRGVSIAWNASRLSESLVAGGLVASLLFQAGVNMAMNVGLSPVTGVPLPLVSYGGSSMLATCLALGILQNIAMRNRASSLE